MKITWFGGSTFRIQIGGQILVVDAQAAAGGIDRNELVSGADHVVGLDDVRPVVDPQGWKRRSAQRLLDAGDMARPLEIWSLGQGSLLVDGDDDTPLALFVTEAAALGRWAEKSVLVLAGPDLAARTSGLLSQVSPRLVALAGDEEEVSATFEAVRDALDGTGLVALEPGLAVEA